MADDIIGTDNFNATQHNTVKEHMIEDYVINTSDKYHYSQLCT